MNEALTEQEFEKRADETLRQMERSLDDAESFEVDLQSGILTVLFEDGTRYVINSHRAARQIWMAADRSAWHFDYVPDRDQWIASKTGDELWSTVTRVIGQRLGAPFTIAK